MQNKEDATIATGSTTYAIDMIDLTKESPVTGDKVGRLRRRCMVATENVSTTSHNEPARSTTTNRQTHRKRTEHSNQTRQNTHASRRKLYVNTNEIVTLDDTVCVDDEDVHYATESDNGEPIPLTCPICYELLCSKLKPTTTRCGHIFCMPCLMTFLCASKKCPTCNANVSLKSCTRLFL